MIIRRLNTADSKDSADSGWNGWWALPIQGCQSSTEPQKSAFISPKSQLLRFIYIRGDNSWHYMRIYSSPSVPLGLLSWSFRALHVVPCFYDFPLASLYLQSAALALSQQSGLAIKFLSFTDIRHSRTGILVPLFSPPKSWFTSNVPISPIKLKTSRKPWMKILFDQMRFFI